MLVYTNKLARRFNSYVRVYTCTYARFDIYMPGKNNPRAAKPTKV